MTSELLHPTPRSGAVLREQLAAVPVAIRKEVVLFLVALLAMSLVMLLAWLRATDAGRTMHVGVGLAALLPMALLGLVAPFSLWKGGNPTDRLYPWALPVEGRWNVLLRVLSGWAWLLALVAVYLLWLASLAWITGGHVEVAGALVTEGARVHRLQVPAPAWFWVLPFTAATVTYLLGSALLVGTRHPVQVLGAVLLGYFFLAVGLGAAGQLDAVVVVKRVIDGRFGLQAALTGTVVRAYAVTRPGGEVVHSQMPAMDLEAWLGATALWLALGVAAFALAVRRPPEP